MADQEKNEDPIAETPISDTPIPAKKKRRLTLKQQAFVSNYTNPDAETYGNGVQSVLAIPHRKTDIHSYKAASAQSVGYLDMPHIQSELQAAANSAGLTYMFRFRTLSLIAQGQYVTTETITRPGKDGKPHVETVQRTPKASEVIKAIDVASKLVGDYEANRVRGNAMSTRFRELARLYRPRISKATAKRLHVDDDTSLEVVYKSVQSPDWVTCSIGSLACVDASTADQVLSGAAS